MKKLKLADVDLKLFDGAGAAGSGAGAAAGGADGGAATQTGSTATPGRSRRGSGEYDNVKFGVQDAPAAGENKSEVQTTSNTLDERKAAFNSFLADNKDLDEERQQNIFNRRFKDYKTLQDSVAKHQPVIDMLMQRYNIDDGDVEKLTQALENDDAYWSEAADEAGMTVEQFKQVQKLKRENQQLTQQMRQRQGQAQAEAQVQQWVEEEKAVKAKYPGFNLNEEINNPAFAQLLKANIPMEQAYKVLHMDELMSDAVSSASAQAEKRVVNNVRAKGARPAENGASAQSGFVVKDDVHKLSAKDRLEAIRRSQMGETISFTRR